MDQVEWRRTVKELIDELSKYEKNEIVSIETVDRGYPKLIIGDNNLRYSDNFRLVRVEEVHDGPNL